MRSSQAKQPSAVIQVNISNLKENCFGFTAMEVMTFVMCIEKFKISEMANLSEGHSKMTSGDSSL